jgi:hypothetical protein
MDLFWQSLGVMLSNPGTFVGGAIIDQKEFPVIVGLCKNACDRFFNELRFIQENHND